jgi:hypothetical protein
LRPQCRPPFRVHPSNRAQLRKALLPRGDIAHVHEALAAFAIASTMPSTLPRAPQQSCPASKALLPRGQTRLKIGCGAIASTMPSTLPRAPQQSCPASKSVVSRRRMTMKFSPRWRLLPQPVLYSLPYATHFGRSLFY